MKYNKSAQHAVAAWNAQHPVGTHVIVTLDDGTTRDTVTRSKAELLAGHTAVIWLRGISGSYRLSRVIPAPAATQPPPPSRRSFLEQMTRPAFYVVPCSNDQ